MTIRFSLPGSQDEAERAYNPRLLVADAASISARWPERAAATRARRPPLEIRYGEHPRETLDLFRAPDARGTVVFIHGGYWRAFSKAEFSWVADGFVDRDLSVAILNYPLCPEVSLERICQAARSAFVHLYGVVLTPGERSRVAVTGHSAGGYLSALHLATDWTTLGLPAAPIAGIVPISGVFRLAGLVPTTMNEAIGLDAATADRLSLGGSPPASSAAMTLVVGGDESAAFHGQSAELASDWPSLAGRVVSIPHRNHFDVVDGLAEPGSALHRAVLAALDGRPAD